MMRNASNLHLHEFIGLKAQVQNSSCRKWIGLEGKVVDETKNLIIIEHAGKEIKIPKKSCVFIFTLENGEKVKIEGGNIAFRPEERTKKAL